MSLDCGRKPENLEETHAENMQTPHREDPGRPAGESNPGPPSCEATAPPTTPPIRHYSYTTHWCLCSHQKNTHNSTMASTQAKTSAVDTYVSQGKMTKQYTSIYAAERLKYGICSKNGNMYAACGVIFSISRS
ncbi:hypothetical protein AOLI_G00065930 [Acnodon oligacanthus]